MRESNWDTVKGIGILLVIVNHIIGCPIISMFHMPLFFIASGYFVKPQRDKWYLMKNFKSLVMPYLKFGLIITILFFLQNKNQGVIYLKDFLVGIPFKNEYGVSFGPLWFLLSLFWCKILYNVLSFRLNNDKILIVAFVSSFALVLISRYFDISQIPYFISTSLPAIFFYSMGAFWKEKINIGKVNYYHIFWLFVLIISISCYQLNNPGLNYSLSRLPYFPFCLINGFTYTFLLYFVVSKLSVKYAKKYIMGGVKILSDCGRYSLDIFLFHSIEFAFVIGFVREYGSSLCHSPILLIVINIAINVSLAFLYVKLKNRINKI